MVTNVLMLGEALDRQGGIVSVETLIIQNLPAEINLIFIPTLSKGSPFRKILFFFVALIKLIWFLNFSQINVVHIHVSERGSAFRQAITTLVAKILYKPVIIHAHSCDFQTFFDALPKIIQSWFCWVFDKSDLFIVLSEYWKNYYVENLHLNSNKVLVMANPVIIPSLIPDRSQSKVVKIVFLGRIGRRKGTYDLVKAFSQLSKEKRDSSRLILAGDGEAGKVASLVKELQLSDHIEILEWLDQQNKNKLLSLADIFVLPSYNEGLPMALLEAMSWGLPVITTPVGGIPEFITHGYNGWLTSPGFIMDISEALSHLIENTKLRKELGINARESIKALDINQYINTLTNFYESSFKS